MPKNSISQQTRLDIQLGYAHGATYDQLAKQYSVSKSTISSVLKGTSIRRGQFAQKVGNKASTVGVIPRPTTPTLGERAEPDDEPDEEMQWMNNTRMIEKRYLLTQAELQKCIKRYIPDSIIEKLRRFTL